MLTGTVMFIHKSPSFISSIERILTAANPSIHIERAVCGSEALVIQSIMRPQVIVVEEKPEDMTVEHMICELKRDIIRPYIMVIGTQFSDAAQKKMTKMGADEVIVSPVNADQAVFSIEEWMRNRKWRGRRSMPEATLQRVFADSGIQFDLKGYRYLKYAVDLLVNGEAQLEPIGELYKKIGEKYGCLPSAVEHNIRYAIGLCASLKKEEGKVANRQFIARLMEQQHAQTQPMCAPRVSVFSTGRRLFR